MWDYLIISNMILILSITLVLGVVSVVVLIKKKKIKFKEIKVKEYIDILWKSMLPAYLFAVINITFIDKYQGGMISSNFNFLPFKGIEKLINESIYAFPDISFG